MINVAFRSLAILACFGLLLLTSDCSRENKTNERTAASVGNVSSSEDQTQLYISAVDDRMPLNLLADQIEMLKVALPANFKYNLTKPLKEYMNEWYPSTAKENTPANLFGSFFWLAGSAGLLAQDDETCAVSDALLQWSKTTDQPVFVVCHNPAKGLPNTCAASPFCKKDDAICLIGCSNGPKPFPSPSSNAGLALGGQVSATSCNVPLSNGLAAACCYMPPDANPDQRIDYTTFAAATSQQPMFPVPVNSNQPVTRSGAETTSGTMPQTNGQSAGAWNLPAAFSAPSAAPLLAIAASMPPPSTGAMSSSSMASPMPMSNVMINMFAATMNVSLPAPPAASVSGSVGSSSGFASADRMSCMFTQECRNDLTQSAAAYQDCINRCLNSNRPVGPVVVNNGASTANSDQDLNPGTMQMPMPSGPSTNSSSSIPSNTQSGMPSTQANMPSNQSGMPSTQANMPSNQSGIPSQMPGSIPVPPYDPNPFATEANSLQTGYQLPEAMGGMRPEHGYPEMPSSTLGGTTAPGSTGNQAMPGSSAGDPGTAPPANSNSSCQNCCVSQGAGPATQSGRAVCEDAMGVRGFCFSNMELEVPFGGRCPDFR